MVEIWRPAGRRDRSQQPPRSRRPDRRPDRRPASAANAGDTSAAPATAATGEAAAPSRENRPPRRDGRPQGKGGRPERGIERGAERDGGPRRERSDHRDGSRRDSRPPRSAEPTRFSTEPPKRDRPADPNSPFAALAALKAELEAKERGG
jgi:ATP-dependent RNA helicase SUPV3L1/SUV3